MTYAEGQNIEYTSFAPSGYSAGRVVRYAPADEQTRICPSCDQLAVPEPVGEDTRCPRCERSVQFPALDPLVYIRTASGGQTQVRESQLRMVTGTEAGELLEAIADLRGSMADGYCPEDVNRILGQIGDASGMQLVCVWDIYDSCGPGGNSQFYVEEADGQLRELAGDLWRWLNDDPSDPGAPASPGSPSSWPGEPADFTTADLDYDDGFCNYARRDSH